MSEQEIQKSILDYLKHAGIFAWRNFNGAMRVKGGKRVKSLANGSPDLMGVLPCGISLMIEVKADSKAKKSKEQIEWIVKAQKNGAIAFFSSSLQTVRHYLDECTLCQGSRRGKMELDNTLIGCGCERLCTNKSCHTSRKTDKIEPLYFHT